MWRVVVVITIGLADLVRIHDLNWNRLLGWPVGWFEIIWPGFVGTKLLSTGGASGENQSGPAMTQKKNRKKEPRQRLFEVHYQETE